MSNISFFFLILKQMGRKWEENFYKDSDIVLWLSELNNSIKEEKFNQKKC